MIGDAVWSRALDAAAAPPPPPPRATRLAGSRRPIGINKSPDVDKKSWIKKTDDSACSVDHSIRRLLVWQTVAAMLRGTADVKTNEWVQKQTEEVWIRKDLTGGYYYYYYHYGSVAGKVSTSRSVSVTWYSEAQISALQTDCTK